MNVQMYLAAGFPDVQYLSISHGLSYICFLQAKEAWVSVIALPFYTINIGTTDKGITLWLDKE